VLNGVTGELLHLYEGSKVDGIHAFLQQLTDRQKQSIVAVGIDRDGAYRRAVQEHLPHADIVYDLPVRGRTQTGKFHLIRNYHQVIDQVRRAEWRRAQDKDKRVIKGQRYLLLKNPENRTAADEQRLDELLRLNENIATVELLKDDLRQLWTYRYRAWAERWLERWIDWALSTSIRPLKRFARGLRAGKDEVLNYCKHRITSGRLEGFNNIISRVVHRACGIKDLQYLFLKLRQESLA